MAVATGNSPRSEFIHISWPTLIHGTSFKRHHKKTSYIHRALCNLPDTIAVSVTGDETDVTITFRHLSEAIAAISDRDLNSALWCTGNKSREEFDLLLGCASPLDGQGYVVLGTRLSGGTHDRGE